MENYLIGTQSLLVSRSILGPLLFALYVNDLPAVVQYSVLNLYADDAEIHCSHLDLRSVCSLIWIMWHTGFAVPDYVIKSNSMLLGSHQRIKNKTLSVTVGGK